VFASVPRVYNRIYDKVIQSVTAKGGISLKLFNLALKTKTDNLKRGQLTHWLWDKLVFAKVREKLGGRVKVMLTGAVCIHYQL